MNILLITGGWSSERDVALAGGKIILESLQRLGHTVTTYDPSNSLEGLIKIADDKDFAFISLHGSPGEDGLIQAILDRVGCPYQGASPAGSMLALNKSAAKAFFRAHDLPTADWALLTHRPEPTWEPPFAYPLFIKANTGGSSLHMERIDSPDQLNTKLDTLFAIGQEYIVEPAISGYEVTCAVLGLLVKEKEVPQALPPILIKAKSATGFFDYASKYQPNGAEEICPAPISEKLTEQIQSIALQAHTALGLSGYSRADFIVQEGDKPLLLEVNTLPGMTQTSLLPQAAAAIGLSFDQLIERLIELGVAQKNKR